MSMMIFVGFFISFLLAGPLFSSILLASYYQAYVVILILIIILVNFFVFKLVCFKNELFPNLGQIYKRGRNDKEYYQDKDRGKKVGQTQRQRLKNRSDTQTEANK